MLFQITAFLIMLVFYGCYLVKLFRQRKQNIQTDLLGKGKAGFVKFVEISLKIATYAILAADIVAVIINHNSAHIAIRIIGAALGIIGTTVFILSVTEMKDSWRAGVPEEKETELVTTGIYRISRNPAFLGFDLIYLGILFMFFSLWLFILTAIVCLLFHLQIVNVEEPFMTDAFGKEYTDYKKTVCRYIGRKR